MLELIEDAGHAVHLEQPERVADAIVEFRNRHPDEFETLQFGDIKEA